MFELQRATLEARKRTGCDAWSTQVKAGRLDIVKVTRPASARGKYGVEIVKSGLKPSEAIAYLNAL